MIQKIGTRLYVFSDFTYSLVYRLSEERSKYLVCELVPELPGSLDQLAAFVRSFLN